MATDAEALAAGFALPVGGDLISQGDNAITQNAKAATDILNKLLSEAFYRGVLTESDSLDSLETGAYSIHSGALATQLGFPVGVVGSVIIIKGDQTSKTALFITRQLIPQLWANSRLSSAWAGWARWDAGASDRWYDPTPLSASEHLDNISESGIRTCWSGSVATEIGSPVGVNFDVETVLWGTEAGRQRLITRALADPQEYIRHLFSGGWSSFKRVDAGAAVSESSGLLPASPTALKRSAMSATTGYGGAQITGQGWARAVVHIPAGVTRARIGIRNWNPRYGMADSPAADLSKISIGQRNGNTSQATSWTQVAATGSTGQDGYLTKWFTLPAGISNSDALVAYGWQSSGDVQMNLGYGYTGATAADATTGTGVSANRLPFFVYLELESQPTVPTVASFTDSIGVGVSATRELYDSWLDQYCRQNGYIPMHWGHSGDSGTSWEDPESKKYTLYGTEINQVDAVLYGMGSNQLSQAVTPTLQEMIDTATKCVENLRKHVSPNVYGCTITPRTNVTGEFETRRRQFNAWMKSSPLFQDVFDMSAAVSLDDETLNPAFDADGIHLNTAGYAAMAAAITRPVVNRGITVSETAGRTVRVWDYLNNREQLIYGDTGVRKLTPSAVFTDAGQEVTVARQGSTVSVTAWRLAAPSLPTGDTVIVNLPVGFRPHNLSRFAGNSFRDKFIAVSGNGDVSITSPAAPVDHFNITFRTNDPWPTSLPGVAA